MSLRCTWRLSSGGDCRGEAVRGFQRFSNVKPSAVCAEHYAIAESQGFVMRKVTLEELLAEEATEILQLMNFAEERAR